MQYDVRGLLADINVQGQLRVIRTILAEQQLDSILVSLGIHSFTFPEVGLSRGLDDRSIWSFCQEHRFALLTENRNHDGPDSLHAASTEMLLPTTVPVATIAKKSTFDASAVYARRVAFDLAELLFSLRFEQRYWGIPRVYLPFPVRS